MAKQVILLLVGLFNSHTLVTSLSINPLIQKLPFSSSQNEYKTGTARRDIIHLLPLVFCAPAAAADPRSTTVLRLDSPNQKAGLKLREETIGTPPRKVVAVEQVLTGGVAARAGVQPGVIILDYSDAKSLTERLRNGPYPIELKLYNLAAGGDAFGDMGKPLVTATDALERAKSTTKSSASGSNDSYVIRVLKEPSSSCGTNKSRRGDVLEINYEARFKSAQGPVYDASAQRGTGLPYQFVLGSGDMIPGVDRGMYDMCPGEVRQLEIPAALGYGPRASKLFNLPEQSRLWWTVELVAVNSVREGDTRTRDEIEGRE